jgi:hypothetical protein
MEPDPSGARYANWCSELCFARPFHLASSAGLPLPKRPHGGENACVACQNLDTACGGGTARLTPDVVCSSVHVCRLEN